MSPGGRSPALGPGVVLRLLLLSDAIDLRCGLRWALREGRPLIRALCNSLMTAGVSAVTVQPILASVKET